jgi:hypothetical protein
MVPTFDGGDDFFWIICPSVGFRIVIGFGEERLIAGPASPSPWMLVGSVVSDGVDQLAGGDGSFDGIGEANELRT